MERPLRTMRVMIDAELLEGHQGEWTVAGLLAGFLTCEGIRYWCYSDGGPPRGGAWRVTMAGERVPVGWVVTEASQGQPDKYSVAWVVDDCAYRTELGGEPCLFAAHDRRTQAYESLGPEQALAQRTADAVAGCAARQIMADLYITERSYLHQAKPPTAKGVTFCTPAEALEIISLYLRTQGDFLIWKDGNSNSQAPFNKGLFYWVGARELLPAGWRWFTACVAHAAPQGAIAPDDDLIYLGGAVFQRISRVLQVRDGLLRAMNCRQDNDIGEDALTALDSCLVFLMGALDAAARVAHRVLGFPASNAFQAKWQNPSWLEQGRCWSTAARRPV